jgi:type VI secretion system protein ImpM
MAAMTTRRDASGFFGKVPRHGDFVARRLPAGFTDPWDAWLQAGMADSRARLGAGWLPVYLNSPIWRFALGAGVCGPQAWCGVMMPSVDRVGRYFPFTIACEADGAGMPGAAWYAALEALAMSALNEGFSLQAFDAALLAHGPPSPGDADGTSLPDISELAGCATFWLCGDAAPVQSSLTAALFSEMLLANSFN